MPPAALPIAETARLFQALADPTRLEIMARLASGERCVCDLTEALAAQQSRLSFHLRTLREAGLVRDRREGRWIYYSIDPAVLDTMTDLLKGMMPDPSGSSHRCCP